jgi:hypothetical protein
MKYRVEGGVAVVGADMLLLLTAEQVAARRHALEPVEDGKSGGNLWRPRHVVQFKSGEEIGILAEPDDLPRSLALVLVPLGKAKAARGKAKAATAGDDAAAAGADGQSGNADDPDDGSEGEG